MNGSVAANDLVTPKLDDSLVGEAARGQPVLNAVAVATAYKQRQETATVTAFVLFGLGIVAAVSQEAQLPHRSSVVPKKRRRQAADIGNYHTCCCSGLGVQQSTYVCLTVLLVLTQKRLPLTYMTAALQAIPAALALLPLCMHHTCVGWHSMYMASSMRA